MKNGTFKETLTLTIKLFVICLIVSGILAYVNSLTAPVISENEAKNFEASMRELLPEAKEFEKLEDIAAVSQDTGVSFESAYRGISDEQACGYVVSTVCHEGYGGDISVMVSITEELEVKDVKIMSMAETAGLGAKASNPEFLAQYRSLSGGIGVEKNNGGNPDNNTISAISGATKTSNAVTKAVNYALEVIENGGGANE